MAMLAAGLLLFTLSHLVLSVAPGVKQTAVNALGSKMAFRGVFSVVLIAALALIVVGWRTTDPIALYNPPAAGRHAAMALMLLSVFLFVSTRSKSNIKRLLRHPQLTGVTVWAAAHLLANGDQKSVILFGTLGIWAILEMATISRREGPWIKPAPSGIAQDALIAAIAVIVYGGLFYFHPYFTGISLLS